MNFDELLAYNPYELCREKKHDLLTNRLKTLTKIHRESCPEYRQILTCSDFDENKADSYEELPFLPVRLFKNLDLKSVPDGSIVKTMTSSGTSGQATSKIYLDKVTASNQQKAMVKIVSDFTGSARMPMIIIDCPSVVKNRMMFSARGAGILGFSIFGSKKIYALDDNMNLDVEGIKAFLNAHKGEKIFIFGFTFMIWQHFYRELVRLKQDGISFDLSNAVMIHGGGWKKLISDAVSPKIFHNSLRDVCGLDDIHDYYGMVEQTGCIYMQCECGHLHASIFSDVIVRRPKDFSICEIGEPGIIQVVSTIPESYPGHSLLTEDEGIVLGEDDCPCGRKGKYFKILGRLNAAEIRGCSDTYAQESQNKNNDRSDINKITYAVGNEQLLKNIDNVSPKKSFDDEIIEFCNMVSKKLLGNSRAKLYSDVVTLGFWLRKASLNKIRQDYEGRLSNNAIRIGRGAAFHIAPSNVPVNFAYSLFAGLITGNANVVRVPSKDYEQVNIVCDAIDEALQSYDNLRPYIMLVRYGRENTINEYLSKICNTRIIWGGDSTIAEIRKFPIAPRTSEITFADRYSLAVIDADVYMNIEDKQNIAQEFYNDTYLSDQNACTSPRVVVWKGKNFNVNEAREVFWNQLSILVRNKYQLQPIQSVDKLSLKYISAVKCVNEHLRFVDGNDNLITRIEVGRLSDCLMKYKGNSGYYYEYTMNDISELRDICNDEHCQTIGIIGDKSMFEPLIFSGIKGVDRIVPIGRTMDFELIWDGYDLVERLTRTIVVK